MQDTAAGMPLACIVGAATSSLSSIVQTLCYSVSSGHTHCFTSRLGLPLVSPPPPPPQDCADSGDRMAYSPFSAESALGALSAPSTVRFVVFKYFPTSF